MNYYYNESEKALAITKNFSYEKTPAGFKKISKEKYHELLNKLANNEENNQENGTE